MTGDLVTMDVHVQQIATEEEPLDMSDFMYTVGSGSITEGVDELIVGMKAGEELKVNGNVAPGVVATFELTLKKVQERELPELSDEWVQENTEWQSEEEMRDDDLRSDASPTSHRSADVPARRRACGAE